MRKTNLLASCGIALVLALAGCATVESQAPGRIEAVATAASPAWPHQASDLPADEAVRFGILPNGMRYALRRNATPPGATSLRLRIDAGSLYENENQRGLAHFLEHMVLNETRNVPEGELIRILERAGLAFGPDTNAFTSFEQTVYMLDLPRTDAETVDTGLFLMREVAGEATLSTTAIDRERGIVLSEERTRATPTYRMAVDELAYIFSGDLLAERIPIGLTDVLRTAPRERFVEFYQGYYRPERATLIAVGDFDLDEMETKIRARFSDWQGKGEPGPDVPAPSIPERQVQTRVFVEPGIPTRVGMSWLSPLDTAPDTRSTRLARLREQLGMQIINRRLERISNSENPPILGGGAARHHQGQRAEVTQLIAVSRADGWNRALQTIEQEQRKIALHGFTQAELDREIAETRARLVASVSGAATRPSPQLAMALVNAVNEDNVFVAPETSLALFDEGVRGLTAAQVTEATRRLFAGTGPLVYLATPTAVEGGEAALLAAYNQSNLTPVGAPAVQQAQTWPYQQFGTPGQIVERREIEGTGATAVRFANGVRLTVKQTDFREDEILVSARFGRGQLGLPANGGAALFAYGSGGFTGGGLGTLTYEQIQQVLAGKVYEISAGVSDDAFTLSGKTRPEDFTTQLQAIAAYLKDPAWRSTGVDRLRSFSSTIHDQLETSPGGVFGRDADALLRSGDPRWETPSREALASMTVDDLRRLVGEQAASGPLEVIIVGDIEVEEAIRQAAATFGALPTRQAPAATPIQPVRFPPGATVTRTHSGRADQGLGFIAWPTTGFFPDQRRSRGLNLLSQVLQLRLNDEIRERQGAAYSPGANHSSSEFVETYGYLAAQVETPPQGIDQFFRDAETIARSLRETPITEDELQRARRPFVERLQRSRTSSNQWWTAQLAGIHERPERAESIRVALDQYGAITAAELQALARQYLVDSRAFKLAIRPRAQ
ncbi:M16 family metallopeptidase [Allosphingosinicella sp.]|uniref:M16 family metallopeptidase n=1 Tax=Allosphingosinicella sp. TaxID=2823234 RepID=UPI002EFAE9A2